jgi:hypothetical protein
MEILTNNYLIKLQNLFSWSQFYQNANLSVNRYPNDLLMCKNNTSEIALKRYYPFNKTLMENKKKYDEIQSKILALNNKK